MEKYLKPDFEIKTINNWMCLSSEKKESEIEINDSFDPIYEN